MEELVKDSRIAPRKNIVNFLARFPSHIFFLFLSMLLIVSGCGKSDRQKAWEEVDSRPVTGDTSHKLKKIEAYEDFLKKYPNGKYSEEAKQIISCEKAIIENTIEAYENFLVQYSGGYGHAYIEENHLEKYFIKTNLEDTIASYEKFIEMYPSSKKYTERARVRLEGLTIKAAKMKNTVQSENMIWEKIKNQERINGYVSYLFYFKNGRFVKDAEEFILSHAPSKVVGSISAITNPKTHTHWRMQAVSRLGMIGYPSAIPFLIKLVDDRTELEQIVTERTYEKTPSGGRKVVMGKPTSKPTSVAVQAMYALRNFGVNKRYDNINDKRVVEFFISLLKDKSQNIRRTATFYLGSMRDVMAVEPLCIALKDEDSEVKIEAIRALGSLKDKRAVEPLIGMLEDENDESVISEINDALIAITNAEFGENHPSKDLWIEWWEQNKDDFLRE